MSEVPVQQKKKKGWGWLLVATVAIGGILYFAWPHFFKEKKENPSSGKGQMQARVTPVSASPVKVGDLKVYLNGLGTATALNTVTVRTRIDGQIMKVLFKEGQTVKEGDPLVEIDPRPYQILLTQAEGQLAKDRALLNNAKTDFARYKNAGEAVSEQLMATTAATVAQYEGTVVSDQGQVDNAKLNLTYCHITAPISGKIGLRLVDSGNMVHSSDSSGLLVITQVEPIAVLFSVPQGDLPQVLRASRNGKELTADAYDRDLKKHLAAGSLLAIDNQIDATTGTVRLKAIFQNKDETLFPNQFVNIRLLVDTRQNVVLAPSAAIQHSPQETFVYVVKADETVEMRTVKTGDSEGNKTVILEGLQDGELVVTEGVDKLQQGSKVSVKARDVQKNK